MIRVWHYWMVRPKSFLLASQAMLLTLIVSHAAWSHQPQTLPLAIRNNLGLLLIVLAPQLCSYMNGLDTLIVSPNFKLFAVRAAVSLGMGLVLIIPLFVLFPEFFPGYAWAAAAVACSGLSLFGLRSLLCCLIKRKKLGEGMLILGTGDLAKKFYNELANGKNSDAKSSSLSNGIASHDASHNANGIADSGMIVNYDELREITLRDRISRIVVAEAASQNSEGLAVALLDCKLRGLEVEQAIESYEKLSGKIWLEALRPEWLVYSEGFHPSKYYRPLKRFFDALCSLVLLALTAPVSAAVALLIKLDSPGPVLFRQVRVGLQGKEFVLLKFRTMRNGAEQETGPVWARKDDPRMTPLGRILRRFRLDELPQAWNVFRGEMSLVGPRPERPYFVELLNQHVPYYGLRHCVKPGITGWAQVLYPYGASVEDSYEKLQYDLYYAKHMSVGFDLRILLSTIRVVLFGRGQ